MSDQPDFPAVPFKVMQEQHRLRAAMIQHETYVVVTWQITAPDGEVLFTNNRLSFINRSA